MIVVGLLTVALAADMRLEHIFTIPNHSSYSVVIDPVTRNFAFTDGSGMTYLVHFNSRRVIKLDDGEIDPEQIDCGARLVTLFVRRPEPKSVTFELASGKRLGVAPGFTKRVGRLFQAKSDLYDVTGKVVHSSSDLGRIVWDGKRRLAIVRHHDHRAERKDIVEVLPGWKHGRRVFLSDNALSFDRVVGNPDLGPFAIFEQSNRTTYTTGLFTKNLSPIAVAGMVAITDISDRGILGNKQASDLNGSNLYNDGGFCLDSATGKTLWETKSVGKWFGSTVISGLTLLNGQTGESIGRIVTPPHALNWLGRHEDTVFYSLRGGGIAAYRIKG